MYPTVRRRLTTARKVEPRRVLLWRVARAQRGQVTMRHRRARITVVQPRAAATAASLHGVRRVDLARGALAGHVSTSPLLLPLAGAGSPSGAAAQLELPVAVGRRVEGRRARPGRRQGQIARRVVGRGGIRALDGDGHAGGPRRLVVGRRWALAPRSAPTGAGTRTDATTHWRTAGRAADDHAATGAAPAAAAYRHARAAHSDLQ